MGTPKRWAEPTTTSAPQLPGDGNKTNAIKSATTAVATPASWAILQNGA